VDVEEFLSIAARLADTDRATAMRAVNATLPVLADRIDRGAARDLVTRLPPEIGPLLHTGGPAEKFDVDEFLKRVAEREQVDPKTAERHASAVIDALARAVGHEAFERLTAQLPRDYAVLLPVGPEITPTEEFLRRVAARAGDLPPDQTMRATEIVLETLAEVIAPGEVEDLIVRLPTALHPALKRGLARNPGAARRMTLADFVLILTDRLVMSPTDAFARARAVLTTLREAVGEEFYDVTVQLRPEFHALWQTASGRTVI
jgi:uncharacterized protein (DUF2267 family)